MSAQLSLFEGGTERAKPPLVAEAPRPIRTRSSVLENRYAQDMQVGDSFFSRRLMSWLKGALNTPQSRAEFQWMTLLLQKGLLDTPFEHADPGILPPSLAAFADAFRTENEYWEGLAFGPSMAKPEPSAWVVRQGRAFSYAHSQCSACAHVGVRIPVELVLRSNRVHSVQPPFLFRGETEILRALLAQ